MTLLKLSLNLLVLAFNRHDLRFLILDVTFDVTHFGLNLAERPLDLLFLPSELLSQLSHFHVNNFKRRLFLRLFRQLSLMSFFEFGQLFLDLVIPLHQILLLLLHVLDVLLLLGNLTDLVLLFVVDHDVLTLEKLKVLAQLLLTAVGFLLLVMQICDLLHQG